MKTVPFSHISFISFYYYSSLFCRSFYYCDETRWPKASWWRKGLFQLNNSQATFHLWRKSGQEFKAETWRQELKQKIWRNVAHWLVPHRLLSLRSFFLRFQASFYLFFCFFFPFIIFYIPTRVSHSPLLLFSVPSSIPPYPVLSFTFFIQIGKVSLGNQQSMIYQVEVGLWSSFLHQVWTSHLTTGNRFQSARSVTSGIGSVLTTRVPTKDQTT